MAADALWALPIVLCRRDSPNMSVSMYCSVGTWSSWSGSLLCVDIAADVPEEISVVFWLGESSNISVSMHSGEGTWRLCVDMAADALRAVSVVVFS